MGDLRIIKTGEVDVADGLLASVHKIEETEDAIFKLVETNIDVVERDSRRRNLFPVTYVNGTKVEGVAIEAYVEDFFTAEKIVNGTKSITVKAQERERVKVENVEKATV